MFAKSKVSRKDIVLSVLLGAGAALIGVVILWQSINRVGQDEPLLPVSTQARDPVELYATQHGAFSSLEAAQSFQKEYPSLNMSIIFNDGQTYYIWSALNVTKTATETTPTSFSKRIVLNSSSCTEEVLADLPSVLRDEKELKKLFEDDKLPADLQKTLQGILALTEDLSVVRLLLFEHYNQNNSCIAVSLDN